MDTVKAFLTKPLDGQPEGTVRDFDQVDFNRLKQMGAVREASEDEIAASPVEDPTVTTDADKDIVRKDPLDHDSDGKKGGSAAKAK
ncbi:MAG TPA: hypothetical protein VGN98_09770 [Tianweitania sediminis]|nr:hypothetical protein [Tianweitania sediminis]